MKISSNQSGALTATKNLVDFDIPAGMTYDLSKSYMVIHSSIETTDTHTAATGGTAQYPQFSGGTGVYNVFLNYSDLNTGGAPVTNRNFKNKHLVRNVSMYSQKAGMVEDIRRSDVLQYNLDQFRDDVDTKVNSSYNQISSLLGANAQNGVRWSPYRRFSPEGLEVSDELDREIRVGLSEVMNSCKNIWDGQKYGNTRVHAELSLGSLVVEPRLAASDSIWAATDGGGGIARNAILAGAGGDVPGVTTTRAYVSLEDAPFYVSQKIQFTGTIDGTNVTGFVRQIVSIEHLATGQLKLLFDTSLATGAFSATAVTIKGVDAATSAVNFDSAELVLYVTQKAAPPQIAFTTYKTEEDSFAGGTQYNHQYYLESDVQNIFWGSRVRDKTLGFEQAISTYRIREGGQDKTDRDVKHGSSLHTSRISRSFANSNMRIKNLSQASMQNDSRVSHLLSTDGQAMLVPLFMIGETCEVTEMPKLLDVNIVATTAFNLITLFKQMVKIM